MTSDDLQVAETSALPAAVLFDFDGTLVDTEPSWIDAEYALCNSYNAPWSHEDALNLVGNDLMDSGRYIKEHAGLPLSPEEIVEELIDRVVEAVTKDVVWRPGAKELLLDLRAAGVRCGLVTMSYRRLVTPVLQHLPADTFEVIVTGDEVSPGKPEPEPYLAAARMLSVDPTACVAVEDSATGAASAEAAGCTVLVVPNHVPVPAGPRRIFAESLAAFDAISLSNLTPTANLQ